MEVITVEIDKIKVEERTRTDSGAIGELAQSIRQLGLLQPIVIDDDLRLHCGGRRLEAAKLLGWQTIPAVRLASLSEVEKAEVELDENIRRKQLTWLEELNLRCRVASLWMSQGKSQQWVADRLSLSYDTIGGDLTLQRAVTVNPELKQAEDKITALRKASFIRQVSLRKLAIEVANLPLTATNTLNDSVGITSDKVITIGDATLVKADCLTYLKQMKDESVDLILTDPPYGIDVEQTNNFFATWDTTFKDSYDHVFNHLLPPVLTELYRVLKPGGHAYFFYPMLWHSDFTTLVKGANFRPQIIPLIWTKGNVGAWRQHYCMDYEPILFAWKLTSRKLLTPGRCTLDYKRVGSNKLHPCEKPLDLLEYLVSQSALAGEVVLDPFAGSGSTVVAALNRGCKVTGIEQEDRWFDVLTERVLNAKSAAFAP